MLDNIEIVRLTEEEFTQAWQMPIGKRFTHINLQHDGIPVQAAATLQVALRIEHHGLETDRQVRLPELDYSRAVLLRRLNWQHSLDFADQLVHQNLLLQNSHGILASLEEKYAPVLPGLNQEIANMHYWTRLFEVLGHLDFSAIRT